MAHLVPDKVDTPENDANANLSAESLGEELSAVRSELTALRAKVTRLELELQCAICRAPLRAPVSLRCGHTFCSECARRALLSRSRCPEAHCTADATTVDLYPVRALEACVAHLFPTLAAPAKSSDPKPTRERMVYLTTSSRTTLAEELRKLGLSAAGTTEVLANRHRDFVTRWNANLDSAAPLPESAIVAQVKSAERALASAASRRPGRTITNLFRKRPAPTLAEDAEPGNGDFPEEGDSHNTQIRKMRRREGRSLPVPRPREPSPPRPREPTPPRDSSPDDLALIEAADRASQGQQAALPPSSPSALDLALIEAADMASQSQEVQVAHEEKEPQTPRTPSRPDKRDDFWATDDDSRSTIAPSPVRPPPLSQSPRPSTARSVPAANATASPTTARPPQSPAPQVGSKKIHVLPWRPFPNKPVQSPVLSSVGRYGSAVGGSSGGTSSAGAFSTGPRNGYIRQPPHSPAPGSGYAHRRGSFPNSASPGRPYPGGPSWRQALPNQTQPSFSQSQGFSQGPSQSPSYGRPMLTEEQRARIERNRLQAIQRQLAARQRREAMLRGGPHPGTQR